MKHRRKFKRSEISFEVTPLQTVIDAVESNKDIHYAQALSYDLTDLFYNTIRYKIKHKENINVEVIGTTRSGKTSVAASIELIVAGIRKTAFSVENFRRDQYDFLEHIKPIDMEDLLKTQWVVDETREAIFQAGSAAQRMSLLDFNNICAILELSIAWLNPRKWDQTHNSQYALHVWGRDFRHKLTRCLLYDINSQDAFMRRPLGYVIVDVSNFVGTELEDEYLKLKWVRVKQQKEQSISSSADSKREMAESIIQLPEWDSMKNKKQRKIFVQTLVGESVPDGVIEEIVELCDMTPYLPDQEQLKKDFQEKQKLLRQSKEKTK